MARRGTTTPEVERLLRAAREQWGDGCVEQTDSTSYTVKPPKGAGRGRLIVVSARGRARGAANAKSMLRQAGLQL